MFNTKVKVTVRKGVLVSGHDLFRVTVSQGDTSGVRRIRSSKSFSTLTRKYV